MKKLLSIAWVVALSAMVASAAQATMTAGWDFSQYISGGGFLSTDGATLTNTLDANYSNLTPNVGPDAAGFGTMYMDGSNGSTLVTPVGDGSEAFLPIAGSINQNVNAPVSGGTLPFNSLPNLLLNGQPNANDLKMGSFDGVSIVFGTDVSTAPGGLGENWNVSFAGASQAGSVGLAIDFSEDGVNYTNFGNFNLTTTDAEFNLNLAGVVSNEAFVRFTFAGGDGLIDNVAINADIVPEPGTALLLGMGLVGLGASGRRRRSA